MEQQDIFDPQKCGNFIRECREAKGLSQGQLAEAVGLPRQSVSKWELGDATPVAPYLEKLCVALDISADELLRGERIYMRIDEFKRLNRENVEQIRFWEPEGATNYRWCKKDIEEAHSHLEKLYPDGSVYRPFTTKIMLIFMTHRGKIMKDLIE